MTGPLRNLPPALTSFIGREQALADVRALLASSRLVTLTGAAGCGKTRLALRTAQERQDSDGVCWVPLAQLEDPALVAQNVVRALGLPEQADRPALEVLRAALQESSLLLILDNCEHLLSACRELATELLAETTVSLLTTSRQPLGVRGENLYPVSPLATPPDSQPPEDVEGIAHYEAVQLFVERARATVPAFAPTPANAGAIADLCRKLDGIPLALELASARINVLALEQIAARLDNQLDLLSPAAGITESHHATLREAIAWSYELLSQTEQLLLRRLSVFTGGWSLSSAETVCCGKGIERDEVLSLLSSLVTKSLVVAETLQRNEARYALLEPIRQYAYERLTQAEEQTGLRNRYLDYYMRLTEEIEPKLRGPYQKLWLKWLEEEYANIRTALQWSRKSDRVEQGLRLAIALYQFWTIRDYVQEGFAWFEGLLREADERVSVVVRATALCYAVILAEFRGKRAAQKRFEEEIIALSEFVDQDDKDALRWILASRAFLARKAGDHEKAYALGKRQLELHRELGDTYQLSIGLSIWSFTAMSLGKYGEARDMLDEGMPLLRKIGDQYRIAMALNFSGDLARCEQDYGRARVALEESISLLREIDAVRDLASALHNLGLTYLRLGDSRRAGELFEESMALHQEQENGPGMTECLLGFAALAIVCGMPAWGARLLAAAAALGGRSITSEWAATSMEYQHYLERARAGLPEPVWATEQTAGRRLSLEAAVAYTQEVTQQVATAQAARRELDELTPREREVVALIARARSNDEIAEELVISKRTVEKHIANIRSKLAFDKRTQIVRWALANGLPEQQDAT